jgi:hypothetical protein
MARLREREKEGGGEGGGRREREREREREKERERERERDQHLRESISSRGSKRSYKLGNESYSRGRFGDTVVKVLLLFCFGTEFIFQQTVRP